MLAAGLVCTPPSSSARLPPIRSSFRTPPSHTPTTTAQHTLYYSISPGASTESRFNTLRRQDTTTQRRSELGTGGGKGIAVPPDVDMHPVCADDGDVRKQRRGLVPVPGTEDGEDNASEGEYSDDDSTQGSEYSDEGEGAGELLAAFSDPGHYTYTDRIHPGPTPTVNAGAAARVGDAPPPKQEHLRPSAPTPLAARIGQPALQVRPKVQFVDGEHKHARNHAANGTHGVSQEWSLTSVPSVSSNPTHPGRPLGASGSSSHSASTLLNSSAPTAHQRRTRYSSSDPGHTFVSASTSDMYAPNPSTRARTMPGYRTAHTPLPGRSHHDTRPNTLDAIMETIPSANTYDHIYTGISSPYDAANEMGGMHRGVVFPCWGSRSTVTVEQASASTLTLRGSARERTVSNKLRKAPPARKIEPAHRAAYERPRKLSSASARRSPVRVAPARVPSPVQRPRTMSFGYLSQMGVRLRRRSDAKEQLKARASEATLRAPMEGYLVEPFGEPVRGARPTPCLSSTPVQTFCTTQTGTPVVRSRPKVIMPESRPMSITSFGSTYTYTADGGGEEGSRGPRTSVMFEDEERALRQLAHSMPHTRAHDAARPTKAAVTSATSGTPLSSTTRSTHKAHSSTRPPPLPSTNMRGSTASSSAATSAATSTNSCASGGWRSSTGSTPPTSPGDSDASGCHDPPPSNHHQSYFAHEVTNVKEEPTERRRAQSERGPTSPDLPLNQKKNKLLKKRPATVSVSGSEMLGSKPRIESGPAPGPSRAKSILGIKIGSSREKTREREGRLASVAEWTEGVEYLPQVRTPSPLWAGSSGMLPSPYSRLALPSSCISDSHLDDVNPTDALASLAFTGHSSALSSSALAALTSRLTHRASSEVLTASSLRGSSKKPKHGTHLDVPPWTAAFSVTPIERSAKNSIEEGMVAGTFDPYAEARRDVKKERSSLSLLHSLRERRTSRESDTAIPGVEIRRASRRENSPNTLRRWTLAMADVPDDVLVQELEKLRMGGRGVADSASPARKRRKRSSKVGETSELGHDDDDWKMVGEESSSGYSGDELAPSPTPSASHLESHSGPSPNQLHSVAHLSSLDDHEWKTARRALLCCRELVRTERNYQARLRVLVSGETSTPPPAIVLTYIPALLHASEALLSRLEDDPSAWGVSAGFVAVEEEVESAFVAWAGVVGEIFVGSSEVDSRERVGRKLTRSSRNSSVSSVSDSANKMLSKRSRSGASIAHARMESVYRKRGISMYEAEPASPPPSRPVSAAVSTMGMFTAALGTGLAYGISPSAPSTQSQDELARPRITTTPNGSAGTLSRTFGAFKTKKNAFSSSPSHSPHVPASPVSPGFSFMSSAKEDEREREKEKEKNPSVRELAILPVQRVMRYVLQYRDLLANTPVESPSRGLVERALESATRIAAKCDRAQDNSAFFLRRS